MHKHLEKMGEVTFDKIFNQKLGEYGICPGFDLILRWIYFLLLTDWLQYTVLSVVFSPYLYMNEMNL